MSDKVAKIVETEVQATIDKSLVDQAKSYLLRSSQKQTAIHAQIQGLEAQLATLSAYDEALLEGLRDDTFLDSSNVIAWHNAPEQKPATALIGY